MPKFFIGSQAPTITFYKEDGAYPGVHRISGKVRKDIEMVTGVYPNEIRERNQLGGYPVIYGTIGKSPILDELEQTKKIDLSEIKGKWEVYGFWLVKKPFEGVECAIVIAGSDKRGTIYGLFHLSELIGVSPLVDWSDVRPAMKEQIVFSEKVNMVSKIPSVKYRGFFINDEWPAFGTWANSHFGGFNIQMYDHVFELLLRLKGNYLWPAMWSACFSCDGPGIANAQLADEYGIVIGTSHHEPCMRNGEEYLHVRGKNSIYGDTWNFQTNREGITRFWEDGLKRNGKFENIITLGMRGERDTKILGKNATLADNINLLKDVIKTQNALIRKIINPDLSQVPRLFVLFTEVESFFYGDETTKGLMDDPLLDDVTLMLCDDNFGNIRSLPTEKMREHGGGYGLYYHLDFHGGAYAYDWMNTNYLPKMWEQLTMAYDYGIRDVWIANVGDISLLEYPLSYFMDLAYDMESMGTSALNQTENYTRIWIARQFEEVFSGDDQENIKTILDGYSKINHNRKPEIMNIDVYHPTHFGEARDLMHQAEKIENLAQELKSRCPGTALPAYYELVYYPAMASMNLSKMWIYATWNDFYAKQGRVEANDLADAVGDCITKDRRLTADYHSVGFAKWYGMGLSEHIGFTHWCEEDCKYPRMIRIEPANKPRLIVEATDSDHYSIGTAWTNKQLKVFDLLQQDVNKVQIDLACGSRDPVAYEVTTECPWLQLSADSGIVSKKDVLTLSIDRSKLTGRDTGTVWVKTAFSRVEILVEAEKVDIAGIKPMTFLEANGYIAIEAEHYCKVKDVHGIGFRRLCPYGRTFSAMKVYSSLMSGFLSKTNERPYLEYRFIANQSGRYEINFYLAPSLPAFAGTDVTIGIQTNDGALSMEHAITYGFLSGEWTKAVKDNIHIYHSQIDCQKGENSLRIYADSPSLVIEKMVIYRKGIKLPESYLGPKESFCVR